MRVMGFVQTITKWLGGRATEAKEAADGGRVVAQPEGGAETEVSTNAQGAGASDEPWPGRDDE